MTPARISLGLSVTRAIATCGGQSGSRSISRMRRPPRVTTMRSIVSSSGAAGEQRPISERRLSGSNSRSIAPAEAAEPLEMLVEPEGVAAVELDRLEGAVAAQQSIVGHRDRRVLGGHQDAVDAHLDRGCHRPNLVHPSAAAAARSRGRAAVYARRVDYMLITGGMVAFIVLVLVLLARAYPGSGADLLDWKPTRDYETEVQLEQDDIAQMLAAQNEYRRRRGAAELTEVDAERMAQEDNRIRDRARRRRRLAGRDRSRAARARRRGGDAGPSRPAGAPRGGWD